MLECERYHVRNYLWIFVNAQIENPSFDSQTKETLTLKAAKFGCAISLHWHWHRLLISVRFDVSLCAIVWQPQVQLPHT